MSSARPRRVELRLQLRSHEPHDGPHADMERLPVGFAPRGAVARLVEQRRRQTARREHVSPGFAAQPFHACRRIRTEPRHAAIGTRPELARALNVEARIAHDQRPAASTREIGPPRRIRIVFVVFDFARDGQKISEWTPGLGYHHRFEIGKAGRGQSRPLDWRDAGPRPRRVHGIAEVQHARARYNRLPHGKRRHDRARPHRRRRHAPAIGSPERAQLRGR